MLARFLSPKKSATSTSAKKKIYEQKYYQIGTILAQVEDHEKRLIEVLKEYMESEHYQDFIRAAFIETLEKPEKEKNQEFLKEIQTWEKQFAAIYPNDGNIRSEYHLLMNEQELAKRLGLPDNQPLRSYYKKQFLIRWLNEYFLPNHYPQRYASPVVESETDETAYFAFDQENEEAKRILSLTDFEIIHIDTLAGSKLAGKRSALGRFADAVLKFLCAQSQAADAEPRFKLLQKIVDTLAFAGTLAANKETYLNYLYPDRAKEKNRAAAFLKAPPDRRRSGSFVDLFDAAKKSTATTPKKEEPHDHTEELERSLEMIKATITVYIASLEELHQLIGEVHQILRDSLTKIKTTCSELELILKNLNKLLPDRTELTTSPEELAAKALKPT